MSHLGCNSARKFHHVVLISLTMMFCLLSTAFSFGQSALTATTLNFGSVAVGTTSATLRELPSQQWNDGDHRHTAHGVGAFFDRQYDVQGIAAGAQQLPYIGDFLANGGGSCPATSITVATSAPNSPLTLTLTGTGAAGATTVSTSALNFGNIIVGTPSAPYGVYLYNNTATSYTVSPLSVSAPYSISSSTCGSSIAKYSNCKISVVFTPTAAGAAPANSLSISTSAPNPLTVNLTGTGIAPVTLSAPSLNFGNVVVGTTSPINR